MKAQNNHPGWSTILFPFSLNEIETALGRPISVSNQIRAEDLVGRYHPDDHLERHKFFSSIDIIAFLYTGILQTQYAIEALTSAFPEDAVAFLNLPIEGIHSDYEYFQQIYELESGEPVDFFEYQMFLRLSFAVIALLHQFLEKAYF